MELNITSGEYFNNYIKTKYPGIFIPFNEAMITGPIDSHIFSRNFIQIRSNYHNVTINEYKAKISTLLNIEYIKSFNMINLWFGEDTFCVINVITILAYLEQINYTGQVFYTRIDDFTNEILKEKEELKLNDYNKIFQTTLINKSKINTKDYFINNAIEQYLLLYNHNDQVSQFIKNNINLNEEELLINSLNISKDLGLSDIIISKIISKFKFNNYNLFYKNQLIGTIKLDLGNNYVTYKSIQNDEPILELLKYDYYVLLDNFPFIKNRIDNMNKFNLQEVNYSTDNYTLKKLNEAIF